MPGALEPSGFFVLRTPLLSFDDFMAWTTDPEPAVRLRELLRRPEVLEALYLASPSLADALADPASPRGLKALPGLASYFTRMCSRVIPFGLLAGLSVGELGAETSLAVPDLHQYRRCSRLDMGYLSLLIATLERDPEIRRLIRWSPNTSLCGVGGRLHFAAVELAGTGRAYNLVAVDETEALTTTLERALPDACFDSLVDGLVAKGASRREAESFVLQMIDAQLLTSDLELRVTGDEPLDVLISALGTHPDMAPVAQCLDQVRTALHGMDDTWPGTTPADYERARTLLDALAVETDGARLFQVDMSKPSLPPTLGPGAVAEIERAVEILHRLSPPPRADDPLVQFRDAFLERYGERVVPLLEALDPEVGIGFGAANSHDQPRLLRDLDIRPDPDERRSFGTKDALMLRKLAQALGSGQREINLDAADLVAMASPDPAPLPDALEVIAMLAAPSPEAVDRGEFQVLIRGILGPPGVSLLGRFCHADPLLEQQVRAHLRKEEACRPDAVFAEVVHLPQGRVGNILCRPVLRRFEIPYLGRSGAATGSTILLSELSVWVTGNRIALWSPRLEREVVPRLTAAHDFTSGSLAAYHFLGALQDQGTAARLGWDWGPLAGAPFLPRVTCGRLVLARAQWSLRAAELADLSRLQTAGRLPRFVVLADGENDLATDLDNPLSLEVLQRHVAGRRSATLMELFPGPDDLCSAGPNGRFMHDLVVPLVRPTPSSLAVSRPTVSPAMPRSFPPGSEWLYFKLYTGPATSDRVLLEVVRPLVDEALRLGLADSWFFVRYADPHWHVRLRLHGDAAALLPLLTAACAPVLDDGRVWRVQLDTYEREIERYGGDEGMALSEEVFQHDSAAVLALLEESRGDADHDARWRLAMLGIDLLLSDLGLDLAGKETWARRQRQGYAREFAPSGRLKGQMGDLYRTHRQPLSDLLEHGDREPLDRNVEILRRRSRALRPVAEHIRDRGLDVSDLASSYAHMHVNRLLRSSHRAQELVIYDLLHRLYVSRVARTQEGRTGGDVGPRSGHVGPAGGIELHGAGDDQ